ncbi:TolC family outer membrane protein [Parasphingorhabdus cellanae]|uniref:TolC family outer membrane protein n=1 Tax=Parasphingorhabdus cellanae TaxID=2806553 RepID=A0ABX7T975_9SPHN|nr:TolC family outer membrane protein [Parasphingorhabdus cellanae]QTD56865.1 TolC family outer membrane protein [Parasphingorhabdus cellanae]
MSKRRLLLSAVAIAAISTPAQADTLREAFVAAYKTNPTLSGAQAAQRAEDENVPIAKADGRPSAGSQFGFQEDFLRNAISFTAPLRRVTAGGDVSVPVYSGGRVKNAVRAAKTRVAAGQYDLRGTEASLFSNVVAAYMDVMRDEAVVRLNRANVGVLAVNLEATSDRFEIGDLTRTDVAQSESRLEIAKGELESARANLIASKENYIALVGQVPGELQSPPPLPNLPKAPDEAVDIALQFNPDLLAAKERSAATEFDIKRARGAVKPTLEAYLQGTYINFLNTLDRRDPDLPADPRLGPRASQEQSNAEAGVRLTIPIYQGGRPAAQIRQAQARSGQAYEQVIATERNIIAQTRAAYSSWRASERVIQSSERAVAASALSLEGVRAENSVGNRTILDILNAEQELLNAQVQLVTARRNSYVAGFTLLAAMGRAEARDLGLDGGPLYDPQVNYDRVKNQFYDFQSDPNPEPQATRTVDTPAQTADIEPLPEAKGRE